MNRLMPLVLSISFLELIRICEALWTSPFERHNCRPDCWGTVTSTAPGKANVSCQKLISQMHFAKEGTLVELNVNILHSAHLFKVQEQSHAESARQLYFLLQLSPAWFTRSSSLPGSLCPGWNKKAAEGYFSFLAPRHWRSAPDNLIPWCVSWLAYK